MRPAQGWTRPEPLLVAAALTLAEDQPGSSWLATAESMLGALPPAEATPARLAAAQIRLAASRRTGDLGSMTAAAAEAQAMLAALPMGVVARCPWIGAQVLAGAALWNVVRAPGRGGRHVRGGHRLRPAAGGAHERADCLGYLARPTRCGAA
jgi:hypothetical protein